MSEYLVTVTQEATFIVDDDDIEDGYSVFDVGAWSAEEIPFYQPVVIRVERITE